MPQPYNFIAPISLMLGRLDHMGRLSTTSPLHSFMSPCEIIAYELGTVHRLS